ncbi:hypothetical protein ACE83Q_00805 [Dellaglioa sp. P0083]|uniref:hypothetical protein n=1 Tax=Dellaglioa kimchii TaxID=3344667 RepID=UPI0038D3A356
MSSNNHTGVGNDRRPVNTPNKKNRRRKQQELATFLKESKANDAAVAAKKA